MPFFSSRSSRHRLIPCCFVLERSPKPAESWGIPALHASYTTQHGSHGLNLIPNEPEIRIWGFDASVSAARELWLHLTAFGWKGSTEFVKVRQAMCTLVSSDDV